MTAQLMSTPTEPYGDWLQGGRVAAGQQVGPGGREIEHLDLVDLTGVEAFLDRLWCPQAELRVPQRAVGVGVPGVRERREVPEHVEQIPSVAQRVDHRRVTERRVVADITVESQVLESLGVRVVRAGLAVEEPEQALPRRAEEVVAAVERRVVERRNVRRALQHGRQRLPGVGAEVDDRLSGVKALDEQHVGPRLRELAGRRRASDVDPQHPVAGVGVMDDVVRTIAGGDDRRVVDDVGEPSIRMNGLYPGPATAPGWNDFSGNPVGPGTAIRVGLKSGAPAKWITAGPKGLA